MANIVQILCIQYDSASDVILAVDTVPTPNLIRDRIKMSSQQNEIATVCSREMQKNTEEGNTASALIGNQLVGNGNASTCLSPLILVNHLKSVQLGDLVHERVSKRANTTRSASNIGNGVEHTAFLEKSAHASPTLNAPPSSRKVKWSIKSVKAVIEDKNHSNHGSNTLFLKATDFQARTLDRIWHRREVSRVPELEEETKSFTNSKIMKGEDEERTLRMNEMRKKTIARLSLSIIGLIQT